MLTQRPSDFDAELERKAIKAKERAKKEQASFDRNRKGKLAKARAKLEALNQAIDQAAAARRARTEAQRSDKIRRAPRSDFVVAKVSRKDPR